MAKQDPDCFPTDDVVYMNRGYGHSALIHLHGATLLSWKCDDKEQLYLSSSAVFDNKKPIRGGVPIVFPNFGPWSLGPQHGFARTKRWSVVQAPTKDAQGNVHASVALEDDEETRAMWDFKFKLVYSLILNEKCLKSTLTIHNTDTKAFEFTTLLHTYFKVANINLTTVQGFVGTKYNDKITGENDVTEMRKLIAIDKIYDRVYKDTPDSLIFSDGAGQRRLEIASSNFPDTVVWNPWSEKAKEIGDFDDDGYKEMLCVEKGKVSSPACLPPGEQYECSQSFKMYFET